MGMPTYSGRAALDLDEPVGRQSLADMANPVGMGMPTYSGRAALDLDEPVGRQSLADMVDPVGMGMPTYSSTTSVVSRLISTKLRITPAGSSTDSDISPVSDSSGLPSVSICQRWNCR
jgi:hypothetical protein